MSEQEQYGSETIKSVLLGYLIKLVGKLILSFTLFILELTNWYFVFCFNECIKISILFGKDKSSASCLAK